MLACNAKGVKNGFPLKVHVEEKEVRECEMNADFVRSMIEKLEWPAFCEAVRDVGEGDLPLTVTEEMLQDEAFLQRVHRLLVEVVVVEGTLTCPESGRVFRITNSIPNMLLEENEV